MSDSRAAVDTQLTEFLGSLDRAGSLPPTVQTAVAQHTLEFLACLFAGVNIPEMQPVLRSQARRGALVAVPGAAIRSEPSLAAGAAAALSHAAELDPIHAPTLICPAAVTVSAALAIAQTTEVTGQRFIAAVCAGYEAGIRLGRALDGAALLSRGWWPTAVCGSFAAAATAAICLGLTGKRLHDAVGLAAVHSGGLAIGGSTVPVARNLLCAQTVRVGVDAALAAFSGVGGPRELFAGGRNLLTAFNAAGDAACIGAGLGASWTILETSLKRWPCALQAQSALDALSSLRLDRPSAATVAAVDIYLPGPMQRIVDRPEEPLSRWAAAASLQFLAASLLLDGDILDSRMESGRADPLVLDLMQRIHVLEDPSLEAKYPLEWPARITLRDSRGTAAAHSSLPPGHPARPLSCELSEERFRRHAAGHLCREKIDSALMFVKSLERQSNTAALIPLLLP